MCNSLALYTADNKSDIDLLIITTPGRLWIARLLMTTLFHLCRWRRHGKKITKRFCLSFWTTEENLSFEKIALPHDPYLALWTASLWPLYDPHDVFGKVCQSNIKFVKKYDIGRFFYHAESPPPDPLPKGGGRLLRQSLHTNFSAYSVPSIIIIPHHCY